LKNKKREENKNTVHFPVVPDVSGNTRLFPDEYGANAASATECTGLVMVAPTDDDDMDAYSDIYSFRMSEPILENREFE